MDAVLAGGGGRHKQCLGMTSHTHSRLPGSFSLARLVEGWASTPKLHLVVLAAVVFACSYAGIVFTRQAGTVSIIWPSDAFVIAALLRAERSQWPAKIATAFIASALADFAAAGNPFGLALALGVCNTLGIIVAVSLTARFVGLPLELVRAHNLAKFTLFSGLIAPIVSAGAATVVLHIAVGTDLREVFLTWFLAVALGILTITPLLLSLRTGEWGEITKPGMRLESFAILAVVAVATFIIFYQQTSPLVFLIYPFLILAAFRVRFVGAALAMALVAGISIPLTVAGTGPFAAVPDLTFGERAVMLQCFLAITVFTILPIAAVLDRRQRLERDALTAREFAERANAAKSAFLANMSHELRTPMTGILGMCDLLLASKQTPDQQAVTETLERSARSFLEMLNDLLDLAKIEAGRMSLDARDFRFSEVMKDALEFFAPAMSQKGLEYSVDWAPLEHDVLKGNAKRLRQILFNLIGNALKFTENGSVIVRRRQHQEVDGTIVSIVEVADTGIGIPEDVRGRLFRPFEQLDNSGARRFGGTGLGLNICKQLVEAMGGAIHLDSSQGIGSTFAFSVRLPRGKAEEIERRFALTPARSGEVLKDFNLSILLVEDNPTTQFLMTQILKLWSQSCTVAANGEQALEQVEQRHFDVILMDMQMPVMDGPEAVRHIRNSDGPSAKTPIIAFTADAIPENRARYLAAGCNGVVTKPIEWDVLAREIRALIDGTSYRAAEPASPIQLKEETVPIDFGPPIFDSRKIDSLRDGLSAASMQSLLTSCISAMDRYMADIRQHTQAGDHIKVKRAAHDLKSICAQFGAARASEIARMIEVDLPTLDAVKSVVAELEDSVTRASARVQEIQVQL